MQERMFLLLAFLSLLGFVRCQDSQVGARTQKPIITEVDPRWVGSVAGGTILTIRGAK
jgi:hypothetical protein